MDDFDTRLRARLLRLADAAASAEPSVRPRLAPAPRMRAVLPAGAIVAAVVLVAAILLLPQLAGLGPSAGTSPTPSAPVATPTPSASTLPSDGISRAKAIALSSQHVSDRMALVSAESGRFSDVELLVPGGVGDRSIAPDRWVWAVIYQGEIIICPPLPAPSASAGQVELAACAGFQGSTTVLLDYVTGDFLGASTYAPPIATWQPAATPSASPVPSGGISRDQAVAIASQYVADPKAFVSAVAERYRDTGFIAPGLGYGDIASDRWVWAVVYQGEMPRQASPTPTPAEATPAATPPTAITTILLDFFTGGFLRMGQYGP